MQRRLALCATLMCLLAGCFDGGSLPRVSTTLAMPTARASLAVVALGGRLSALGGESTPGTVSDAVECYDPATQAWSMLPAMPYRSHGLGAVPVGDAIDVMGGFAAPSDAVGSEAVALYRYQP